jgi:4-oxalocrotonate tautomerase family enzyme
MPRSAEEKQQLISNLTDAVVSAYDCSPEVVQIIIDEIPLERYAKGGISNAQRRDAGALERLPKHGDELGNALLIALVVGPLAHSRRLHQACSLQFGHVRRHR